MSKRKGVDIHTALAIVDDDLPDGAYFAMLDELTGSEPAGAISLLIEAGEAAPVEPTKKTYYDVKYYDANKSRRGQGVQCRTFTDRAAAEKFASENRIYGGPCKVREYTR